MMKNKFKIWFFIGLVITLFFGSCDSAKRANHHFEKFIKHGGKIDTVERVVPVPRIMHLKGRDSIIYVDSIIPCPEAKTPPTKAEMRHERKMNSDSLNHLLKMERERTKQLSDSLDATVRNNKIDSKQDIKQNRNDNKTVRVKTRQESKERAKWGFWIVLVVSLLLNGYFIGSRFIDPITKFFNLNDR